MNHLAERRQMRDSIVGAIGRNIAGSPTPQFESPWATLATQFAKAAIGGTMMSYGQEQERLVQQQEGQMLYDALATGDRAVLAQQMPDVAAQLSLADLVQAQELEVERQSPTYQLSLQQFEQLKDNEMFDRTMAEKNLGLNQWEAQQRVALDRAQLAQGQAGMELNRRIALANLSDQLTQQQLKAEKEVIGTGAGLAKELMETPEFKSYSLRAQAFSRAQDVFKSDSKVADRELVVLLGKALDPGSVVMPGEAQAIERASALIPSLGARIEAELTGSSALTKETKLQILQSLRGLAEESRKSVDTRAKNFAGIWEAQGGRADEFVPKYKIQYDMPESKLEQFQQELGLDRYGNPAPRVKSPTQRKQEQGQSWGELTESLASGVMRYLGGS